jgi:ATP-binding cassette subfamily B protein
MKILFKYLKHYKWLLVLALVLAAVNQGFSLLDPQVFRLIIDRYATNLTVLDGTTFIRGVLGLLGLSVLVALISRIAKNFQDYYVNVITERLGTKLYADSVGHAFSLPYSVFEDERSGELLQKLQKARADSQKFIQAMINVVFLSFVGILFVVIYAFTVHYLVALAYLFIIPVLGGTIFFISKKIKVAQQNIVKESAILAGSTTETLRNVELVKSLGLEDQELRRLNGVNEMILSLELKKVKLIRTLSFIQGTLINLLRAGILFLLLYLVFTQKMTFGEFFSLYFYSFFIFGPLGEFSTVASTYQETRASLERLQEVFDKKPVPKKSSEALPVVDRIAFENVTFAYEGVDRDALSDVSLSVSSGETVAFVGPSGSGKTTLVKLMTGLYDPNEGTIRYGTMPHTDMPFDAFRRKIGLVAQETQLFAGSIRENLLFVKNDATDDECLEVLKDAHALSIIERGGEGLDTKIGEGGIKLSGGERQRLAIARALLREPALLIFDEATSALDSITERSITDTMKSIPGSEKRMTVLVAHRLSTIMHANRIYVLEKGKVVEMGTHEELLGKKGLYGALWREQSGSHE